MTNAKSFLTMAKIESTDYIFAEASAMGNSFFNFEGQGITSFSQLINLLRANGAPKGLITVTVRNSSQGWASSRNIYSL